MPWEVCGVSRVKKVNSTKTSLYFCKLPCICTCVIGAVQLYNIKRNLILMYWHYVSMLPLPQRSLGVQRRKAAAVSALPGIRHKRQCKLLSRAMR